MIMAAEASTHRRGLNAAPSTVMHVINVEGPGGAETVCARLVERLDRARWRAVVVVPSKGWLFDELTRAGVEVVVMSSPRRRDVPRYFLRLLRLARQHDARLLHGHLLVPSVLASLLGFILRVPVVCTFHGQVDLHPRERFRWLKLSILRLGATRVVFVSESLRAYFLAAGLRATRTDVIANGVDVDRFHGEGALPVRAQLGIPEQTFLVGAVGNVRPAKGYDTLLRAAAQLRECSPDYHFVVVGDAGSPLGEQIQRLRDDLGLRGAVTFTGYVSDVASIMRALDVYALTSTSEGFSISTIEAMAASRPIVATRCGGPEEILEHGVTGLLVAKESPDAIAQAIDSFRVNRSLREDLGAAALEEASRRFSIEHFVDRYEALYDQCVSVPNEAAAHG